MLFDNIILDYYFLIGIVSVLIIAIYLFFGLENILKYLESAVYFFPVGLIGLLWLM